MSSPLLVFDCGTGAQPLMSSEGFSQVSEICLFFTHYHHDHLMGLSHFSPFFQKKGPRLRLYGQAYQDLQILQILERYFEAPFFPLSLGDLPGLKQAEFQTIRSEQSYWIGPFQLSTCALHHPQGALAYRCALPDGRSFVYATDHEEEGKSERLKRFIQGTDMLIMDTSYLDAEWKRQRRGWGHSSCLSVARLAREAKVKKLFLFHYAPEAQDSQLRRDFLQEARSVFEHSFLSFEGLSLFL